MLWVLPPEDQFDPVRHQGCRVQTPTNIAGFVAERTPVLAQILTNYNQKIAAGGKEAALAKAQLQLGSYVYLIGSMLGFYGVTRGSDIRLDLNKLQNKKFLYNDEILPLYCPFFSFKLLLF